MEVNYLRYYVLLRLKDLSHIEAEFNTKEELEEFLTLHKDEIIPYESIIQDNDKIQKERDQEFWGKVAMIAFGLITLYFMFR